MGRTGFATLPLHGGRCPPWLFERMRVLAGSIVDAVVYEFGPEDLLERLSDPYWFQSLGCLLGFDWHSSGLTTTTTAAIKEGIAGREGELGVFIAGGKGRTSLKTPGEIQELGEKFGLPQDVAYLKEVSRLVAKVDNSAVLDGYNLYHHVIAFTENGHWAVIQQGLNESTAWARRYHWFSSPDHPIDFICEPHAAVCCDHASETLNMVAKESASCRRSCVDVALLGPNLVVKELSLLKEKAPNPNLPDLHLPRAHSIPDLNRISKPLLKLQEADPKDFIQILRTPGVGPATIRALALVSEICFHTPASRRDPALYSFAHGGKDGHPFPVNKTIYDRSISVLKRAINEAKMGRGEKLQAMRRLGRIIEQSGPRAGT